MVEEDSSRAYTHKTRRGKFAVSDDASIIWGQARKLGVVSDCDQQQIGPFKQRSFSRRHLPADLKKGVLVPAARDT
jgi:hypothetical protein